MKLKRILYCEDDADSAQAVQLSLLHLGHTIDYAQTADQAVQLFDASKTKPYDLIITDVDMVGHTGMYFASHARANGYKGRIVILTGFSRDHILTSLNSVNGEYWQKTEVANNIELMVNDSEKSQFNYQNE